jgi:hypothetical protein
MQRKKEKGRGIRVKWSSTLIEGEKKRNNEVMKYQRRKIENDCRPRINLKNKSAVLGVLVSLLACVLAEDDGEDLP